MPFFTARGEQAREALNRKKVDLKKVFIRLKDGQSVRVRILDVLNYVTYEAHEAFQLGIYRQPCILPTGSRCAYDEVVDIVKKLPEDHELKKFEDLKPKERVLFAFGDLDAGEIRFLDVSKGQARKLVANIEQYKDHIGQVAFMLQRTGEKADTSYSLNPILALDEAGKQAFAKFDGQKLTDDLFEDVLAAQARTFDQQLELLKNAGFPVEHYFDVEDEVKELPKEEVKPEDIF